MRLKTETKTPIESLIDLFNKDIDKKRKEYLDNPSMRVLRELSLIEDVVYQLERKLDYEKQYHKQKT
jgi:hypothetical protein